MYCHTKCAYTPAHHVTHIHMHTTWNQLGRQLLTTDTINPSLTTTKSGRLRWSILFWAIQFRKCNSVSSISSRVKYNRYFTLSWEQRQGQNKKYFLFVTFLRGNTQKSIETETADIGWPGKTLHVSHSTTTQQAQAAHSAGDLETWIPPVHTLLTCPLC